ncbi:MAG: aminopeptidase N [Alphaproteobacteria bacterium]
MKTAEPRPIHLKDYRPPAYRIPEIALDFRLEPEATRVIARTKVERTGESAPLVLDGNRLKLAGIKLGGKALESSGYELGDGTLTIHNPPARFALEIETEISPAKNTWLEGLYLSNSMFCTQCEPEGFRCITYFIDRPDNLARYETRIEAPKSTCPVMLSNGNCVETGDLGGGRHFARWRDPFPKPSYLFALVAGDLAHIRDTFTTMSGRKVELRIYVEHGNENKVLYAMESLKRAMRWDEVTYGREYDLDIFMIVAVSAFNFGAMENKGLNIFNDKALLASPETATDDDYARIESVVGHEYFHNWSGDRITCRDWFQLSLKEGLTVFRESHFSEDMRSAAVKRIEDVKDLRLRQFQEDGGPLAHPVQPQSYITIDNFYTATVYEKGAEVIRMLRTLLGAEVFRKGMDLYFARHDGHAATVEDFVRCFEDVSRRDLTQFRLWYRQAGTPEIEAAGSYDAKAKTCILTLRQSVPLTPGQPEKKPMHIPLAVGLIGRSGRPLHASLNGKMRAEHILELREAEQRLTFENVDEDPVLSIGRGFSAPVLIKTPADRKTRAFLLARDTDPFNRWEADQRLCTEVLLEMAAAARGGTAAADPLYVDAVGHVLAQAEADPAFTAQVIVPPSENELALAKKPVDPEGLHAAREALIREVANAHRKTLQGIYARLDQPGPFSPDAASAGRRSLRNAALTFLTAAGDERAAALADTHYREAANMTDMIAGLANLNRMELPRRVTAFQHFHDRFRSEPLVLDKWMGLQAMSPLPGTISRVRELMKHPAYSLTNPNRVRSLIGTFASGNPLRFHDASGDGYRLVGEVVRALDPINPQTAARIISAFETWKRYDERRQGLMRGELESIGKIEGLSANLYELITKMLG